jgi:hypothetical protein
MAKYLVKEKSVVNGMIAEEGSIVDYTPPEGVTVSPNLEPYKEPGGSKDPHAEGAETAPGRAPVHEELGKKK